MSTTASIPMLSLSEFAHCSSHEQATLPFSFSILARSGTPSWTAPSRTTCYGTRHHELLTSDSMTFSFSSLWSNPIPYSFTHQPPWSSFEPLFTQSTMWMSCFGRHLLNPIRQRSKLQMTPQWPPTFTFIRNSQHGIKRESHLCFRWWWHVLRGMWGRGALHLGL